VSLIWLYAISSGAPSTAKGIEGREVRAIEEAGLTALVSDVPEDAYEQAALDESVRDGEWLTPRATAHQDVNAAAHAATEAVLPVPFGTIYRSDERVREMLRERADELHAKLEQVRGRSEWVLALYRDTPQAAEHLSKVREALEHTEPVAAGPGRRYLEERKSESARRADLRRLDEDATVAAQHAVGRVSKRSFEEPVLDDSRDLVSRTTYLVRRSDEHRLHDAMRGFNADWQERGYELRATGPWPPYRTAA
jgi:hypothetical protein